ncbi:hypothetical protein HDV06_003757 [Boothiomyces sp. JEL0866]|nr:hypothetical protein HDV06_003757 [Boothiomyces sp. JEL0866]
MEKTDYLDDEPPLDKVLNDMMGPALPPLIEPADYVSVRGAVALFIAPFFQGLFYGLGEGFAKITVGRWVGLDPYIALGGSKTFKQRISELEQQLIK